jgi:MFS family permease
MTYSPAAAAPRQRALLRFAPAVLIIFFGYVNIGMQLAVLPLQVHDWLSYGTLVVGITIGIQSLVTLATRQLAGSLCDLKGAKHVVLRGGGWSLAACLLYLFACAGPIGPAASLTAILIARVILGIGESLLMTGSLAWAVGTVGPRHTGKVMVWVGIGMYGAVAVGAPLGFWLITRTGVAGGFSTVALGGVACALLATLIGALIAPVAPHSGERLPFIAVAARIAPFGAGLTLATVGFSAIAAFAALDFQARGWPGAGFALAGFGAAYIVTRVIFGHWPDRFGGARVAFFSLVIETCGQILLWLAPVPAVAFAGAIMTGAGFSLVFPSFGIEAVKSVPAANRGAALGAYAAFFDLGFALAGPVTGLIAGALGYPPVFAAGALSAIVAVLPVLYASRRAPRAERAAA